ncbi:septum formation family protein [Arthrobacter koreensis]|uniref:septum formation family protein n=1 Tax=Arthrobacter koreensis TaxID=199136 RepID=UPI002DB64BB5|nr:septum formation family protein [Arthrobacter koreensis]MEB7505785.1 septum formation family protein [Arthrobacter koreensis]
MSDQKRTPQQGKTLRGQSPRPPAPNGSTAAPKGSGAKPPAPKTAPPVRNNPATRSIPVIKPQPSASNGRPGPADPADRPAGSKPVKPAKPGKSGRKLTGAKRPAAAKQGTVSKGLLGSKGGAKRPALRPGPGAKQNAGPADEPTPKPSTPENPGNAAPAGENGNAGAADSSTAAPAPDQADKQAHPESGSSPKISALPDLSAHTDSPAWLSAGGTRDAELWDGAFDAEAQDAAPAEPSVVPAEDVHLEEPSLETPSISSDAAEAASLPETAAEVRAVSEQAAEAGKQAGISEPAPEGTEVAVEPGEGLTELEPAADDKPADQPPEPGPEPGPAPEEASAEDESGETPGGVTSGSGDLDEAVDSADDSDAAADTDAMATDSGDDDASGKDPESGGSEETGEDAAPDETPEETARDPKPADGASTPREEPAAGGNTPKDAEGSGTKTAAAPAIRTSTVKGGSSDVGAPVTDSFESLTLTKKDPDDTGLVHTVNPSGSSALPADSRRARRTREAEEAAARSKGPGKTTRTLVLLGSILIVVLLGIWLATVIADSNREAGVLEDSVAPVDLEAGACLQDFQSVNAEVTVVTCETAHNAQLVATSSYADSDTFPGTDALAAKAEEVCSSVIYTDAASKYTDLELNRAVPTQSSWDAGDRRVDCFVVAPSEELTESLIVQP